MALREYLSKISAGGGDYPQKIAVMREALEMILKVC